MGGSLTLITKADIGVEVRVEGGASPPYTNLRVRAHAMILIYKKYYILCNVLPFFEKLNVVYFEG